MLKHKLLILVGLALAACGGGDSYSSGDGAKLCGKSSIRGEYISTIPAAQPGCGLKNGVKVRSVAGIRLSTPATLNCTTAKALEKWVRKSAQPAVGRRGGGLEGLQVYASYSCRTRNNVPGAKVSEHGRGKAIDIGGFLLADGSKITVLDGWQNRSERRILKKMHRGACGTFGTVLGPEADRYHANHFHFDTARYSNGSYCK